MGILSITLFGSLKVALDGVPRTAFESDKVRALLAYLVAEAEQAHQREALAELLWAGQAEKRARSNLRQALYSLRSILEDHSSEQQPLLLVNPDSIQLNPAYELTLDTAEFNRLVELCDRHAHHLLETCPTCQEHLQRAAALYQGEFLQGFSLRDSAAFDQWVLVNREHYMQKARRVLANLASSLERQGALQEALQVARRLKKLDPLDDDACQLLLRVLAANGMRGEALAQYESFRSALQRELELSPLAETTALYHRIRQQNEGQPYIPVLRHNLPASLSPLIGREAELAELKSLMLDPSCRLLTILGPGGSGKSRLALEAACGLLEHFADGVYLLPLSPLTSLDALPPGIAQAIGLQIVPSKSPQQQIQDYLRQKELLLVLDGCEARLEAVPQVLELMRAAPHLKVLATSRARLNAEEEQVYLLAGLECPSVEKSVAADSAAAVRLFTSCAHRVRPGFELETSSLDAVVEICKEVQGMPLAILLAAAWVELFSPAEILAEMHSSLDFLQAEWADLPLRQRSVRATFDYSWRLLKPGEQATFEALCIFRGIFTRQAAEAVCEADPQMLRHLADKSFVMHLPGGGYLVHTLLRQFGLEKLYQQPTFSQQVHQHYSAYYLNLLGGWQTGLQGASQNDTLAKLDAKINDLRPAWDWAAVNKEVTSLARGLEGLCLYYELRARFREGQSACQFAVQGLINDNSPQAVFLRAHLLAWESRFYRLLGEYLLARQRRDDSQLLLNQFTISGQEGLEAQALIHLEAGEAIFTADLLAAQMHLERSLAAYRLLSDTWHTAGVLVRLGINRGHAGDYFASEPLLLEALDLYQKLGSLTGCALAQRIIAQNQMRLGKVEEALGLMRQVLAVSQAAGNREQVVADARSLASALLYSGQYEEIYPLLMQTLPIAQDLGNRYEIAFTHLIIGEYGVICAQYDLAQRYLGTALDLARHDGFLRETAASLFWIGCSTLVEKSPTQARQFFQECIQLYRKIGYADELSWTLSLDACCQLLSGEGEQVRQQLLEALEIALSTRAYLAALYALAAGALWLGSQGEAEKAVEYFAMLMQHPPLARSAWFNVLFGKSIQAFAIRLQAEIAAAAQARGAQRQLWQAVGELHQFFVMFARCERAPTTDRTNEANDD